MELLHERRSIPQLFLKGFYVGWALVYVRGMDLHKHLLGPKEAEQQDKDELD